MRNLVYSCIALLLCFVITGLIGCGEESDENGEVVENASWIQSTIPKDGAKDVPTTASILAVFDRDIVAPSSANLIFVPDVGGKASYDSDTCTVLFRPSTPLSDHTDYSMTIDGISDTTGETMSPVIIKFTTSVPDSISPKVTSTFPEDGQKDLAHNTEISITFSEPIDRIKFPNSLSFYPGVDAPLDEWLFDWDTDSDAQVTILPPPGAEIFEPNEEYSVILAKSSVLDLSGNSIPSDFELRFRTLRYPVEEIQNLNIPDGKVMEPIWMYTIGRIGKDWVVMWGSADPPGAPSGNNPSGTVTASADGRIQDEFEALAANPNNAFTQSVSRGNGNKLTFTSANLNDIRHFRIIFRSTSSYLTFELRSAAGILPAKYVHIGSAFVNPSRTPFILKNDL